MIPLAADLTLEHGGSDEPAHGITIVVTPTDSTTDTTTDATAVAMAAPNDNKSANKTLSIEDIPLEGQHQQMATTQTSQI